MTFRNNRFKQWGHFFFIAFFLSKTINGQVYNDASQYKFSSVIYNNIKKDSSYWRGGGTSSDLSFIGLYRESLTEWDKARPYSVSISEKDSFDFINGYKAVDAKRIIFQKAKENQIIIFNEAHYNPRNRVFVTGLLEGLQEIGYRYFAAETFINNSTFQKAIHPSFATGYYTMEPQFGNLVREAQALGYILYPYEDSSGADGKLREVNQAKNIHTLLKKDPSAKIIIYCGFSHIYEDSIAGWGKAMAGRVKEFTGIDPYTIDQIELMEKSNNAFENPYFRIINCDKYSIFLDKTNKPFNKQLYEQYVDAMVYLPKTNYIYNRPDWIFENRKLPYFLDPIDIKLSFPFLAKAYNITDNLDQAIPVDIIEIKKKEDVSVTAISLFTEGQFVIKLQDTTGKAQLINVKRKHDQ